MVETTWLRWFRPLFGATAPAASATLVAFFTGQLLGAWFGARIARRSPRPLASYARLEAAAALWALAVPVLLVAGEAATSASYDRLRELPALLTAARFATALVATLPAAFCFGATLPVLGAAVIVEARGLGRRGSALYGANLLGAALGTALAAFVLPDRVGVTTGYAVGLVLIAGASAGAFLLSRRTSTAPPAPVAGAAKRGPAPHTATTTRRRRTCARSTR